MTSRFSAVITVEAGSGTGAVFSSVEADGRFGPGGAVACTLEGDVMSVRIESDQIQHLRAGLNSTLRLVQAGHDAIEAVRL